MITNFNKVSLVLSWIMRALLLAILLYETFYHNIVLSFASFFALILSLSPAIAKRTINARLPFVVDFAITLSLFLHIFGLAFNFYHDPDYYWWDQLTHFLGVAVIAFLSFMLIFTLTFLKKIKIPLWIAGVFIFSTALAVGALWEVSEYYFDQIFGTASLGDIYDYGSCCLSASH